MTREYFESVQHNLVEMESNIGARLRESITIEFTNFILIVGKSHDLWYLFHNKTVSSRFCRYCIDQQIVT